MVRAADLPPPHRISDEDFDSICAVFTINRGERDELRRRLDEIAAEFAANIQGERLSPDRKADRDRVRRLHALIKEARRESASRLGEAAASAFERAAHILAVIVSKVWLRGRFLDERLQSPPREIFNDPREFEREEFSRLIDFARDRPIEILSALLGDIATALSVAEGMFLLLPRARGGRKPLTQRKYLIANLAISWNGVGRQPTSGPNSQFTAFCEAVFEAIGWPTDGVEAAVPDALAVWRNPP